MLKIYIKLLPLQGVTNEHALTQGVASLALGYVLLGFQPVLTKSELESNQKIKIQTIIENLLHNAISY